MDSPWGYKRVGHDLVAKQPNQYVRQLQINSVSTFSRYM